MALRETGQFIGGFGTFDTDGTQEISDFSFDPHPADTGVLRSATLSISGTYSASSTVTNPTSDPATASLNAQYSIFVEPKTPGAGFFFSATGATNVSTLSLPGDAQRTVTAESVVDRDFALPDSLVLGASPFTLSFTSVATSDLTLAPDLTDTGLFASANTTLSVTYSFAPERFTAAADSVNGTAGNNYVALGRGADIYRGRAGDDTMIGGKGADSLFGGPGRDTVDMSSASAGVTVNLAAGTSSGGGQGRDALRGIEGIDGSKFSDLLSGDDGINEIDGRGGADTLLGGKGNDTLLGGSGADRLDGQRGADFLFGGDGADRLTGRTGADTLSGGAGRDTLDGGSGADVFNFFAGFGRDQILDFQDGTDLLSLSVSNVAELAGRLSAPNPNATRIEFGDGDSLLIKGLPLADFDDSDLVQPLSF